MRAAAFTLAQRLPALRPASKLADRLRAPRAFRKMGLEKCRARAVEPAGQIVLRQQAHVGARKTGGGFVVRQEIPRADGQRDSGDREQGHAGKFCDMPSPRAGRQLPAEPAKFSRRARAPSCRVAQFFVHGPDVQPIGPVSSTTLISYRGVNGDWPPLLSSLQQFAINSIRQ